MARAGSDGAGTVTMSLICKDGRRVPTEYSLSILKGEKGSSRYIVSIGRDVTGRNKAEADLALHGQIMTHMREAVYLIRAQDGIIVYSNPEFDSLKVFWRRWTEA